MRSLALGALSLDPRQLISTFGFLGIIAIVFAESGMLVGFFFPGDSLLFTAGLLTHPNDLFHLDVPIALLCVCTALAAIAGDQCGYQIGHRLGPRIFNRPDSRLFKKEYVERAEEFFDHYGSRAIVLARFVPIVRTFVPVVIGVSNMDYRRYVTYDVLGGTLWGAGMPFLGWALGNKFPGLTDRIELLAIAIVAISLVPIGIEVLRHRRRGAAGEATEPAPVDDTVA